MEASADMFNWLSLKTQGLTVLKGTVLSSVSLRIKEQSKENEEVEGKRIGLMSVILTIPNLQRKYFTLNLGLFPGFSLSAIKYDLRTT